MEKSKKCSKCKIHKNLEEYHRSKNSNDGFRVDCKECRKVPSKSKVHYDLFTTGMKLCNGCKCELPLKYFSKSKRGRFNLSSKCRQCKSGSNNVNFASEFIEGNKRCSTCGDLKLLSDFYKRHKTGKYRSQCKDCCKKYTEVKSKEECEICSTIFNIRVGSQKTCSIKCSNILSKGTRNRSSKNWAKNNPAKRKMHSSKRRHVLRKATPKWVNYDEIDKVYLLCKELSKEGDVYHVDHIIPLINDKVCGLNITINLQILKDKCNLTKGNSFDFTLENESWKGNYEEE